MRPLPLPWVPRLSPPALRPQSHSFPSTCLIGPERVYDSRRGGRADRPQRDPEPVGWLCVPRGSGLLLQRHAHWNPGLSGLPVRVPRRRVVGWQLQHQLGQDEPRPSPTTPTPGWLSTTARSTCAVGPCAGRQHTLHPGSRRDPVHPGLRGRAGEPEGGPSGPCEDRPRLAARRDRVLRGATRGRRTPPSARALKTKVF